MVRVRTLLEASGDALEALNRLVAQLRQETKSAGTLAHLEKMIGDEDTSIVVADDDGAIVGVAFLYMAQKLGKRIAFVEDVVVDETYRGQGVGKSIMTEVISLARAKHATYLTLTSRAVRQAANAFYQKLGFELKETNVYRLNL